MTTPAIPRTSTTTTGVPAGLDFDPVLDPQAGRHLLLAARWGVRVHEAHDDAGMLVDRDYFALPPREMLTSGDLKVNRDHNPRLKLGRIVDGITDHVGVWLVVQLGDLTFDPTDHAVSLETIGFGNDSKPRWTVTGVAILSDGMEPGIPGAHVVFESGGRRTAHFAVTMPQGVGGEWADANVSELGSLVRAADATGGRYINVPEETKQLRRDRDVWRSRDGTPDPDIGRANDFAASMSMSAVDADVARDRARFERQRESAQPDPYVHLREAMVPISAWPIESPERQSYEAMLARQEQQDRQHAEQLRARAAERRAAAAAERAPAVQAAWQAGRWRQQDATHASPADLSTGTHTPKRLQALRRALRAAWTYITGSNS